jgi:ATP-dependent Lhr-like helicase
MLDTAERLPWAGHSARHALGEIYELIKRHKMTLSSSTRAARPR